MTTARGGQRALHRAVLPALAPPPRPWRSAWTETGPRGRHR